MKAIIHLKNDGFFCHPAVGIEVNFSSAPKKGDWFYLCPADYDRIFKVLNEWEDKWHKPKERGGREPGNADEYYEWWNEEDKCYMCCGGMIVIDTAFFPRRNKNGEPVPGEYILHIEVDDHGR